jgi:hypothetical protein
MSDEKITLFNEENNLNEKEFKMGKITLLNKIREATGYPDKWKTGYYAECVSEFNINNITVFLPVLHHESTLSEMVKWLEKNNLKMEI